MVQLLRLIVIIAIVWALLQLARRGLERLRQAQAKSSRKRSRRGKPAIGDMVQCAFCGTHIPQADAIRAGDRYYCQQKHLQADRQPKD